MKAMRRGLVRPLAGTALLTAFALWAMLGTWFAIEQQRDEHATLAAASAALRPSLAETNAADAAAKLAALAPEFSAWQLTAAAFDGSGAFLGGDAELRGDGLSAGHDAAPPAARQVSIVPARGGYVLIVRDPHSVTRFRLLLALQLVAALTAGAIVAFGMASLWAAPRARAGAGAREYFRAIADGRSNVAVPIGGDPVFGELTEAAHAAIERLGTTVRDRADSEERLRSFLADAGHELRTPLAIAVGYLGILKRGALEDPVLAERIIRDVGGEHERLTRLVDNILYLARLDAVPAGAGDASDVARVAREAIALVRPLDLDREIACDDRVGALAAVGSDDLRDALRNVLENAIRYAPGARIAIAIEIDGGEVVTSVRDAGPGMDAFTEAHAFDRFFRGANREVPGTGLGLAIVRRIVERAGGAVRLDAASGRGTTVEIRLPRADQRDFIAIER